MNEKKSIWDELMDLPRDKNNEEQTWMKIEKRMAKPKLLNKALTMIVTIAMMGLMFTLLNTTKPVEKSIQGTFSNPTLDAIYFMNNSNYEDFKARNSVFYTYVHKNDKPEQLKDFQTYLERSVKVDVPRPSTTYLNGMYSDVILKYNNGSELKYKVLVSETGYLYNLEEQQWYLIKTKGNEESEILFMHFREVFDDGFKTSWVPMLILINSIFTIILEKTFKRKYKLKKIVYGGENKIAKAIIYTNMTILGAFLISIILFGYIVHLIWILLIVLLLTIINIVIEKKYGKSKAAIYMLICSSVGILLFTIFFCINI